MNEIKITHELSEADRKRLDDLCQAIGYLAGQLALMQRGPSYDGKQPDPIADLPEEVQLTTEEAKANEHPVENPFPEVTQEAEAPKKEEPSVTKDDVRKIFVKLAASGKKEQAREIVNAFAASIAVAAFSI